MKKLFAIGFVFIAFIALVVMPPGNTVKAYEYETIETLDCDLTIINDVEFEITKTMYPVMIVEVEISPGDYCMGLQDNICYETNHSQTALLYNVDEFNEVKTCTMFYDTYRYEQANINKGFKETERYCTKSYYSCFLWQDTNCTSPDNNSKLETRYHGLKFCNLQQEVGISPGVILGLQIA